MSIDPYASPAANVSPVGRSYDAATTEGVIRQLAGTKPWVRFISVMTFVGAAFMLLAALGMLLAGGAVAKSIPSNSMYSAGVVVVIGALYVVMALLFIYPGVKLWKYASHISEVLRSPTSANLEAALREQRAYWKFVGVVVLVILILYALATIGLILVMTAGVMKAQGA